MNKRGNVITALITVVLSGTMLFTIMLFISNFVSVSAKKIQATRYNLTSQSMIETFLVAYRYAEMNYLSQVGGCSTKTFIQALTSGHGCASAGGGSGIVSVFSLNDIPSDVRVSEYVPLYDYFFDPNLCVIKENEGIKCNGRKPPFKLITIGVSRSSDTAEVERATKQRIENKSIEFSFNSTQLDKYIVEIISEIIDNSDNKTNKLAFAVRSTLQNAAHLEVDGRVTQQNPDPTARCPGSAWASYLVFNPIKNECESFVNLGSGTGLAFYLGRYFGLRSFDGQIVDLLKISDLSSDSYFVNPSTGKTCESCPTVFPKFNPDVLVNTDDITLIDDQIYLVKGMGEEARISVLDSDGEELRVCPLGKWGWAQSYTGIASVSWSQALLASSPPFSRMASFYLKTDSGDLLSAQILSQQGNGSYPGCMLDTDNDGVGDEDLTVNFSYGTPTKHFRSCCFIAKDANQQEIEYKRTLGFDRNEDTRPYFIF